MEMIMDFLKSDNYFIILFCLNIILLVGFLTLIIKFSKLSKKYKNFMQKIGNGKNIEEDLENYMYKSERIEKQNLEILNNIKNIENDLAKCIKKIGMVRYNAFRDTGSNLSFALALLDENNNGVVLNGIYSREMSNIYAKPVENGVSPYTVTDEEKEAIHKALQSHEVYSIDKE